MSHICTQLANVLNNYLSDCHLSKIACFTNFVPSSLESQTLTAYLSYICFCVPSLSAKSSVLRKKYLKFKKVPFDVIVSPIEKGLVARQYNYLSLVCQNPEQVRFLLSLVVDNKSSINKNYPILLRLIDKSGNCDEILVENASLLESQLAASDIILRIGE